MSTRSIRAEVAKTILESGHELFKTRRFVPDVESHFSEARIDGASIIIPAGGMLILTVDHEGSRVFVLQDSPAADAR